MPDRILSHSDTAAGRLPFVRYMSVAGVLREVHRFNAPSAFPIASFSIHRTGPTVPVTVQLIDTSQPVATSWLWDFGDGTTSTERSPWKIYTAPGVYTIRLTVQPGSANATTFAQTITASSTAGGRYDAAQYDVSVYAPEVGKPSAPTSVTGSSPSTSQATITWQPPASDGGTPITGYRVSRDGVATSGTANYSTVVPATQRSFTMNLLYPGRTYNLTVAAINTAGEGVAASVPILVGAPSNASPPSQPTGGSVFAPSNSQATIAWSPPVLDGGSPITGYRVSRDGTATSGTVNYSTTVSATTRSFTMNLLYPGRTYNLSVAAINGAGTGPAFSGSVLIPTEDPTVVVPTAPTNVVRTATSTAATISWAAPADTGGGAVTGYRVTSSNGATLIVAANVTTHTFGGLAPSTAYVLSVAAINSAGEGASSVDDVTTLPGSGAATPPTVPTSVTGDSPSSSQATIFWSPPVSDGGSPITGYRVSRDGNSTSNSGPFTTVVDSTRRDYTMNLLISGTQYRLSVAAINAIGDSPVADSLVTVDTASTTLPTVPTSVTRASPTSDTAVISWQPPTSTGGSPITGYRVTRNGTSTTGTGVFTTVVPATDRTFTFGLMRSGLAYELRVAAITAVGEGPASIGNVTIMSGGGGDTPSGVAMPTGNLQDFTLLFTDDFNTPCAEGAFLSTYGTRWRAYPNTYKDTSGRGTYEPRIISVANSTMYMKLRYESSTGRYLCAAPEPKINGSGARGQTYGRYSVRFRAVNASAGFKTAWLLWPDSNNNQEGEIDCPEGDLNSTDTIRAYSHEVQGIHENNAFSANSGVKYVGSGWHTVDIVWRPTGVTFYLDGRNLGTAPKLGTPVTPLHWILQSETILGSGTINSSSFANLEVDWVAVWKYTPGTPPSDGPPPPPPPPGGSLSVLNARIVGIGGRTSTKTTTANSVRLKIGTDAAVTQNVVYTTPVTPNAQGWAKHVPTGLTDGVTYYYRVEMTEGTKTPKLDTATQVGRFTMPPSGPASFSFTFSSCSGDTKITNPGVYTSMANRHANDAMFLHLGDLWYDDGSGVNLTNFRAKMQGQLAQSNIQNLISKTAFAYTPSDHDFGMVNNGTGGTSTSARDYFNQTYRETIPNAPVPATTGLYHTWVWGRIRFINADLRSFKSNPANSEGSSNVAMGATQETWFKNVITNSTEKVIFVMSETTWNAPSDNLADDWGGYTTERTRLASFIASSGKTVVFLCGDAHCLGYNPGDSNSYGGVKVFQAAPIAKAASTKSLGSRMVGGVYPSSDGAFVSQYGRVTITDSGGPVTVLFKGYSGDGTERKSYSFTVA